jgi:putative Ca2+/H+ antiporter (TMEM165/GDT1 family)
MGGLSVTGWLASSSLPDHGGIGKFSFWPLTATPYNGVIILLDRYSLFSMEAFFTTFGLVALVEMGDKTQIATMALAAQFKSVLLIVAGSTIAVLVADIPVILLGDRLIRRIPACGMRWTAAGLFGLFGVAILFGW